ncbi:complex I NDUFA9 subunit family protein [Candidatus Falkowbacteria bacterium]|nr:complex I NDUFA9 subunit family protein [Candidatus Falkowbacteria bacterium]
MSKLVTIYGGSGFVGRYIAQRMAREGWRVRVAVRRPNDAIFVRPYGTPGQVEPVLCNIRDEASVRAAMAGADAVVNCVGILVPEGKNRFDSVQAEGAARIARIAAETGVGQMVHISAIGADPASNSLYSRTKGVGEDAVRAAFPTAAILRPSVIFGPEDQFFNRFASMARFAPALGVVGGRTKFQPVYVDDVAAAAAACILKGQSGTFDLGGPEVMSFADLMRLMLRVISRPKPVVSIPFPVAQVMGGAFDLLQDLTGGFFVNRVVTLDQIKNLRRDNVVAAGARGFADLGLTPTAMEVMLPEYLWRFRPGGQYEAIKASARNMRKEP